MPAVISGIIHVSLTPPELTVEPEALTLRWPDGACTRLDSLWLRDNRFENRDPHSGQRLIDILDLPESPRIRSAGWQGTRLQVSWVDEPDQSASFALEWLTRQSAGPRKLRPELERQLWLEGATMNASRDFAWLSCGQLHEDPQARLAWSTRLLQQGMAFLSDVPCTDSGILDAMAPLGQVSTTNYGLTFDVRSVPQPENLAYSDLGLGLHTDNPYREPVPGFQSLHALVTSTEGGDSLFADGFALAEHLRVTDPDSFAMLSQTRVPFHYQSREADLFAERPLVQLDCRGQVAAVHYNNRSIAPLPPTGAGTREFYAAYRRFAALLREPQFQVRFRLRNGDLVMFDNLRVLHGRTAFLSARQPRHLKGCYLSRDSVFSTVGLLRRQSGQALPA